jgi:hypothetical protein
MAVAIRAVTGRAGALFRRLARLARFKQEGGERAMTSEAEATPEERAEGTAAEEAAAQTPSEAEPFQEAAAGEAVEDSTAEATEEPPVAETAAEGAAAEETAERQPPKEPSDTTD